VAKRRGTSSNQIKFKFMKQRMVIALGGNVPEESGGRGTYEEQMQHMAEAARELREILLDKRFEVAITHGNGPQVGNILLQNEAARRITPPMPMFLCGAMSQGEIGYILGRAISDECAGENSLPQIATIVTSVEVSRRDPAFKNPSKPVGPFCTESEAERAAKQTGYVFMEDAGRGYRRVVPSPEPLRILEIDAIRQMLDDGIIPIACGGGGIPVVRNRHGGFSGIDAVIDKDKAAALLADLIEADRLVILTAVEKVLLNFGTENEKPIDQMSVNEAKRLLAEGQFAEGSMKPKIEAAARFVANSRSRQALITHSRTLMEALEGKNGTWIRRFATGD